MSVRADGRERGPGAAGALSACRLCPRACGADRRAGRSGYCRAGNRPEIYAYGPHHGEEPPVSGTRGSGTVFFSRCTLRCLYCQNYRFSQEGEGRAYGIEGLTAILRELHARGCHNWNLVSPTPWMPFVTEAVDRLKQDGVSLPIVYNTSGFEVIETLRSLEGRVAVYLTDLRYAKDETAAEGSDAGAYAGIARAALREMWRQAGPLRVDGEGVAVAGTICRLLVLPGHADEAEENLRWIAREIGTGVAVSVMAQYWPAHRAVGRAPWGRRIRPEEYAPVRKAVEELGFAEGWVQDIDDLTSDELAGFNMKPAGFDPPQQDEGTNA